MADGLTHFNLDELFAGVSVLLLLGVLASKASSRLGIPSLVVFMLLGMLAGSEGIGGIYFDDAELARSAGILALVMILFSGGLDSNWWAIRPVLIPGVLLATVGVLLTAVMTGIAASFLLGLNTLQGFLLGAIVSSTDAAAVFAVLKARSLRLKGGLSPLLELESGSNDPMAVFLTISLSALLLDPSKSLAGLLPAMATQTVIGGALGYLLGRGLVWGINHLRLDYVGLYPVLTLGGALAGYAITQLAGGSGFLAVYVAGVVMSNQSFLNKVTLLHFHEGIAWLMQIAMFLSLGLLVFPSRLVPVALPATALACFLILVGRPLAVFVSLAPVRKVSWRQKVFVSWVGLRGAIPIILATIPLTAGVPGFEEVFDVVFFIVVASAVIQGTSIKSVAKALGVLAQGEFDPRERLASSSTVEVIVSPGARAIGMRVVDLNLPKTGLIALLTRGGSSFIPRGETVVREGDKLLIATRKNDIEELKSLFSKPTPFQAAGRP